MVVDADALNLLAAESMQKKSWVLTPHPGEAARLLNCSTKEAQESRLQSVQALQKKYSGVVVLKGSGTLVADETRVAICTAGNPGMASGGMGDVLTGIIAGLIAQGLSIYDAARFGVQLHAQSADIAAEQGMRGMLASDLFTPLRKLVNN
jgi:NAD(P)H-hydrate epimerase